MEIEIIKDTALAPFDTGGGIREVKATIYIDPALHPRVQRHVAIYETLGSCLEYSLSHSQLEELTHQIVDTLDQLEAINGSH